MLCPDTQALAIFGSILDGWGLKAGKLLAKESGFPVMVRPLTDNPINKWSLANKSADDVDIQGMTRQSYTDTSQDEGSSEDEDSTSEEDMESDTEDLGNVDSVFRLRGGSGTSCEAYDPKKGPLHNLDIHLAFQQKTGATNAGQEHDLNDLFEPDVSIRSKIQFTVQSTHTDKHFNGYRPQVVSWTKLIVEPTSRDFQVLYDRSYASIGFLVHEGKLDCEGYTPPKHTAKTVETKTKGMTGTFGITGGIHPTGTGTINRTKATAKEKQNDRVTPAWCVHYDLGATWSTNKQSYSEKNVSFSSSEGKQDGMDVEYSIGINVGDRQNPADTKLPRISFTTRNQTIFWVPNKSKSKGYGIIVFTAAYIRNVETTDPLGISDNQIVELMGNSMGDVPDTDKTVPNYDASLLLSVGVTPSQPKLNVFDKIANTIKPLIPRRVDSPEPPISVPLYDFKARGWDVETERWRMPIYPRLDSALGRVQDPKDAVWDLQRIGVNTEDVDKGKGKERDPGPALIEPQQDEEVPAPMEPGLDLNKAGPV
ncbi:hypothetical protein B0H13DRAFT_2518519 [Mycena leptocephala]|nr:hypothetical protein B0H13DRAFT_2518519 [Mycena leptocephala]